MNAYPRIPNGWRADVFTVQSGQTFTRAIDGDGCCWYSQGGRIEWVLNVPWFRRTPGCIGSDDIAVVETVNGHAEYPITEGGTIKIGSRRVSHRKWSH